MDYEFKQNEGEQNYSKDNQAVSFLKLSAYLAVFVIIVYVVLNFSVSILIKFIPEGKEYKIFSSFEKNEAQEPTIQEQELNKIIQKLLKCANLKHDVKIELLDEKTPNAAATINSKIYVNNGLFKVIKSENALAFVLSHEIAHFKNRDHIKGIGLNVILSILFDSSTVANLTQDILSSKYSKKQEEKADKLGLEILNCAYGHIGGADEFFLTLLQYDDSNAIKNLFGSHPLLQDRIKKINNSGFQKSSTIPLNGAFK